MLILRSPNNNECIYHNRNIKMSYSNTELETLNYSFNSYTGDTLEMIIKRWTQKSDAVILNPPYQNTDENGRKASNRNLWSTFITELFKVNNHDDYLLFITPCTWMPPTSNTKEAFYDIYIVHLNINECEKHFNVGSKFSYYLIQKTHKKEKTRVLCSHSQKITLAKYQLQILNFSRIYCVTGVYLYFKNFIIMILKR